MLQALDKAKTGAVALKGRDFKISEPSQWNRIFEKAVKPYLEAGKVLSVSIGPFKKKRSVDQNKRYFALLNQVAAQMPALNGGEWYSPDAYHEYCKRRFLGVESGPFDTPVPKSTTKLSTTEFAGYCMEVEAHFIEMGVIFDMGGFDEVA